MTDQNTSTNQTNDTYEKNKVLDQVALLSFIDDLIRDRKDPNITEKNMEEMRAMLLKKVNEEINIHMINCLTDKDRVELDMMLDKNPSDKELHEYFVKKIQNLDIEIAAAMLKFRASYLYPVNQELQNISQGKVDMPVAPQTEKSNGSSPSDSSEEMLSAPYPPQKQTGTPVNLPPAPVMGKTVN